MLHQGQHAAGDQVHGGFVAGDDQQEDHRHQLVVAHAVGGVVGFDQGADQVVARLLAALANQLAHVAEEEKHVGNGPDRAARRGGGAEDGTAPAMKLVLVAEIDAQHFGDDRGGNGQRVVANQVDAPAAAKALDQLVGQRLDAAAHAVDDARREGHLHQRSQAGVIRRIDVEHVAGQRLEHRRDPGKFRQLLGRQHAEHILGESLVLEHHGHVVVAGDQPGRLLVGQHQLVNGRVGPQVRIERIRIGLELGAPDIELQIGFHERAPTDVERSMGRVDSADRLGEAAPAQDTLARWQWQATRRFMRCRSGRARRRWLPGRR